MKMIAVLIGIGVVFLIGFVMSANNNRQASASANGSIEMSLEAQAWALIDNGALLVDTRSQKEFDTGYLEGAILIPHDQVEERLIEFGADKSRPIVLYCRAGNRAGQAEKVLRAAGFSQVLNAGGYVRLKTWKESQPSDG